MSVVAVNVNGERVNRLAIFVDFRTDWSLPKFKKAKVASKSLVHPADSQNYAINTVDVQDSEDGADNMSEPAFNNNNSRIFWADTVSNEVDRTRRRAHAGWLARSFSVLRSKFAKWQEKRKEARLRDPSEVMEEAHTAMVRLYARLDDKWKDRLDQFQLRLNAAKSMHQTQMVERLEALKDRAVAEAYIAMNGYTKFLTEEQAVRLILECKKGLTVCWVQEFARVVPESVCMAKLDADTKKLFDNYVVMHFDPRGQSTIKMPKDPILFGVLRCSNRLYFITDWTDDVCQFTLAEAEKLLNIVAPDIESNLERP